MNSKEDINRMGQNVLTSSKINVNLFVTTSMKRTSQFARPCAKYYALLHAVTSHASSLVPC